jgi:hypothetical protein
VAVDAREFHFHYDEFKVPVPKELLCMNLSELNKQLNESKKVTTPRTAILWGREDLLGKAVESILTADRNWHVIKIPGDPDFRTLTQEVERISPEIVIINQGPCTDDFPAPIQLLENFPKLKVITVNPDNNLVEVYNKQKFCLKEVSDLLSVIDNSSNLTTPGGENKT